MPCSDRPSLADALSASVHHGQDAARLSHAARFGNTRLRLSIALAHPGLLSPVLHASLVLHAIDRVTPERGLVELLDLIERFHPPLVRAALWRALEHREGNVAMHYAALLCTLAKPGTQPFDREWRPLLMRFLDPEPEAREAAIAELSRRLGRPVRSRAGNDPLRASAGSAP